MIWIGPTLTGGCDALPQVQRTLDSVSGVLAGLTQTARWYNYAAPIHWVIRQMMISNECLLKHLYCCTNTAFHCFTAMLRKTWIQTLSTFLKDCLSLLNLNCQTASSVNLFAEFIVLKSRNGYRVEDLEFRAGWHSGTSEVAEVYRASKPSVSAERHPSSNFTTWTKNVLLRILIGWFRQLGVHKNVVFLNYKQKRVIFILGELNCRLPAPAIPSRNCVGSGDASVNIISVTVKV
jgi:hypothetical protein